MKISSQPDDLADPDPPVFCLFHRLDPARNIARFYLITTGPVLLDAYAVTRFWGRIGGHQRHLVSPCGSAGEALSLASRLAQRRLKRGYRLVQGELPLVSSRPDSSTERNP
jgi:predicted DNA-binding WGR domain protein